MLIIVVVIFGLCWLPLQLYNILYVTIPLYHLCINLNLFNINLLTTT